MFTDHPTGSPYHSKPLLTVLLLTTAVTALTMNVAGVLTPHLRAQELPSTDPPKFDAVSIKVDKNAGSGRINLTQSGGHLAASNVSLKFLIIQAYGLSRVNFGSNPGQAKWLDSEHFDIEAEVEGDPTVEQKRSMIQSLLADRFKLTMRHETRQLPIFALILANSGRRGPDLRVHAADAKCVEVPVGQPRPVIYSNMALVPPCGEIIVVRDDLAGQNVTMEKLAETLSVLLNRNVVDRTGMSGTFDVTLHFQREPLDETTPDPSGPPSMLTALNEQLGLKLVTQTGPVDVLVIDHVEEPSAN